MLTGLGAAAIHLGVSQYEIMSLQAQISSNDLHTILNEGGNILEMGKVGTGIKELETEEGVTFAHLTELLKPLILSEKGVKVIVKPKIVVEINYEEIQKSPTYNSGYALRFPRMIQIRQDKPVNESSGLNLVEQLYVGQR